MLMILFNFTASNQKTDLSSTPPRPTSNPPSLPVQLSVKTDVSPVDTKPPSSFVPKEKPVSSDRRASSDRPESTKRPASSVTLTTDQPVAKRPMASSSCERSSSDGVSNMTVSTSVTPASVPHKRAPTFEAEGLSYYTCYLLDHYSHVEVWLIGNDVSHITSAKLLYAGPG